jgi:hypothetical protein
MRSSTSNFKERLRLPRLFFRRPTPSEQVHGGPPLEFERPIPRLPWRGVTVIVVLVVMGAVLAWEIYCRSIGYGPSLNDNADLWTLARRKVKPESLLIVGDSRPWFDVDLDEIQRGLGKRPIQLAMPGSCAYPVLADLANDEAFHGTIICSIVPHLFFAPPGSPPMDRAEKAVRRYHTQTLAQRTSEYLAIPLEEHVAFLKQKDLALDELLKRFPIPNRLGALVPPRLPPYFQSVDRERRARMIEQCAHPGKLQSSIQQIWLRLFTPPPPPSYIPKEKFMTQMHEAIEARFNNTVTAVNKLRARGGKIVFVQFPHAGGLKELEDRVTPRVQTWDPLLKRAGVPGIHFQDFPELATFNWS